MKVFSRGHIQPTFRRYDDPLVRTLQEDQCPHEAAGVRRRAAAIDIGFWEDSPVVWDLVGVPLNHLDHVVRREDVARTRVGQDEVRGQHQLARHMQVDKMHEFSQVEPAAFRLMNAVVIDDGGVEGARDLRFFDGREEIAAMPVHAGIEPLVHRDGMRVSVHAMELTGFKEPLVQVLGKLASRRDLVAVLPGVVRATEGPVLGFGRDGAGEMLTVWDQHGVLAGGDFLRGVPVGIDSIVGHGGNQGCLRSTR